MIFFFLSALNPLSFSILAGQTNITHIETAIDVIWLTEHPDYDDFTIENDINIMRTGAHFTYGPTIAPAILPVPGFDVPSGNLATVSGWGTLEWGTQRFPDILQAVDVPAMTNAECQAIYVNETILPFHIWFAKVSVEIDQF